MAVDIERNRCLRVPQLFADTDNVCAIGDADRGHCMPKCVRMQILDNRIRDARERRHLTQEKLSEIVDISPTHMSVLERGVKGMKLSNVLEFKSIVVITV